MNITYKNSDDIFSLLEKVRHYRREMYTLKRYFLNKAVDIITDSEKHLYYKRSWLKKVPLTKEEARENIEEFPLDFIAFSPRDSKAKSVVVNYRYSIEYIDSLNLLINILESSLVDKSKVLEYRLSDSEVNRLVAIEKMIKDN